MQIMRKHSFCSLEMQYSWGKVVGICMQVLVVEIKLMDFRDIVTRYLAGSCNRIHEYREKKQKLNSQFRSPKEKNSNE